nr:hypothetical protein [Tanacetum cinerariifolium]
MVDLVCGDGLESLKEVKDGIMIELRFQLSLKTILLQGLFQKLNWLFPDLCFRSFLSGCFQGTMLILDNSNCGETYNSKYKDACELLKMFDLAYKFETESDEHTRISIIVNAIKNRLDRDPVKNVVENQEGDAVKKVVENQEGDAVHCPKRVNVAKPVTITKSSIVPGTSEVNDEGFVEVKNRKKTGKNVNNTQVFGGIRLPKPTSNIQWQKKQGNGFIKAPKATTYGTAATPQAGGEKSTPTSNAFDVLTLVKFDNKGALNQSRDLGTAHNGLDSQIPKSSNKEAKNESSKGGNEEVQSKGHGSLWEKFKASKEAFSSKSNSTSSDPISSNADYDFGNQLKDDFSDGYEAQNVWAVKIKNIDGKVVGRKAVRGIQSVASNGGALDASWKDDYSTSRLKKNSNSVTFHNLDTNIPTANEKHCDDEQSQVHDQSKDSKIKGKKDGNAWNTPFIKSMSLVSEPDGGLAQKKMIKIMELHNEEVVEGTAVAIPLIAVEKGRNTYARALIEVSEVKALLDLLVMAMTLPNGKGHTLETIKIEYEWKPPRCESCKNFDHIDTYCPKRVEVIPVANKPSTKPSTSGDNDDGFVVVQNQKKKKGLMVHEFLVSSEPIGSGSSKANDDKVLEEDSLWSRFQILKKASKSQDHKDASNDESEVEEYPRYDSTGLSSIGGSFSLEDDDLACYDGYEA